MSCILQVFYSFLSGAILALAIPNEFLSFGSPFLGLISLIPLYIATYESKNHFSLFLVMFVNACTTHLFSSFWLSNFHGFALFTLGASCIGTGCVKALFSIVFFHPLISDKRQNPLNEITFQNQLYGVFRIFYFTSFYVAYEWIKSTGFLAYPWGTLSMTVAKWRFIPQIADIAGVYGITFLLAFFSSVIGEGLLILKNISSVIDRQKVFFPYAWTSALCLILFGASFSYGAFRVKTAAKPSKTLNAVLVQQNRDPWARDEDENILLSEKLTQQGLEIFKARSEKCDLVVWSEAVLSKRFPEAEMFYNFIPEESPLLRFVAKTKIPFVIGGPVLEDKENLAFKNSALFFDKDGKYVGHYAKMHLVPFAEHIPGRKYKLIQKILKKIVGFSYGWTPGDKVTLFEVPLSKTESSPSTPNEASSERKEDTVLISTPICFDDSAHEVCRAMFLAGSEVFVNLTNDSWSKTKSAEIQHFVVAMYRAIEYRTTLVRSTNSGITAVVDNTGRTIDSLPLFQKDALACKVPVYPRTTTFYAVFGNWLPILLLITSTIFIVLKEKEKIKK